MFTSVLMAYILLRLLYPEAPVRIPRNSTYTHLEACSKIGLYLGMKQELIVTHVPVLA